MLGRLTCGICLSCLFGCASVAQAATYAVDRTDDPAGPGANADAGQDTITLPAGTFPQMKVVRRH